MPQTQEKKSNESNIWKRLKKKRPVGCESNEEFQSKVEQLYSSLSLEKECKDFV